MQWEEGGYLRRSESGRRLLRNPILTYSRDLRQCRCLSLLVLYVAVSVFWPAPRDWQYSTSNSGSPFLMVRCVTTTTAHDLNALSCRDMWWQKTWDFYFLTVLCGGGIPGRGSPSSSAARSVSRAAPSPSPASPASPSDSPRSADTLSCQRVVNVPAVGLDALVNSQKVFFIAGRWQQLMPL